MQTIVESRLTTIIECQLPSSNGHPVIGILVVGLLLVQPFLGLAHHQIYKREHRRTLPAIVHVWWGRIIVTLAIINGGLGLQLSNNTKKGEIAYGVIAGVMWLLWVIASAASTWRTKNIVSETGTMITKKRTEGIDSSEDGRQEMHSA